jgi:hypothetical protein
MSIRLSICTDDVRLAQQSAPLLSTQGYQLPDDAIARPCFASFVRCNAHMMRWGVAHCDNRQVLVVP